MKSVDIRGDSLRDSNNNDVKTLCNIGIEIAAQMAQQSEYLEKMYALHAEQGKRNAEAHEVNMKNLERDAPFWEEKKSLELQLLRVQLKMWGPIEPAKAIDDGTAKK